MINTSFKRLLLSAGLLPALLFLAPSFALDYTWTFTIAGQKNGQNVPVLVSNLQGSGNIISPKNPAKISCSFDPGSRYPNNSFRVTDLANNNNYCDITLLYRTVISPQTTINGQCSGTMQYSGERYLAPDKNCGTGIQDACFTLNFSSSDKL